MPENDKQMDAIADRIALYRQAVDNGVPLTEAQLDWMVSTLERQHKVVISGEALIEAQQIALLNRELEIFNLKGVPLTEAPNGA